MLIFLPDKPLILAVHFSIYNLRKTIIIILISLSIGAFSSFANVQNDSLITIWKNESEADSIRFNALEKYYDLYYQNKPESALESLKYYTQLAKEKDSKRKLFEAYMRTGNIHRFKGNLDIAMDAYLNAKKLSHELNDPLLKAAVIGNLGNIFVYKKDYKKATQYFSEALKIYQNEENSRGESHMFTSLGSVFIIIHNYDLALQYYEKALAILDKRGFEDRRTAIIYVNLGWTNFEMKKFEVAKEYYERGLKLLEEKNEKFFMARCYSPLSKIYLKLGFLDKANDYAERNLKLNQELDLQTGITEAQITIAQLAYESDIDESTIKAEAILKELPPKTSSETKRDLYLLLYKCYKAQGKMDLSLNMHELYSNFNDSVQLEKNNFAVAREAVRNEFEQEIYENKLLNEREKANLEIKQLKLIFATISFFTVLFTLFIYYFISKNKKDKKRRNELLQEINTLKIKSPKELVVDPNKFELSREKIEKSIERNLNDTDWKVLSILMEDPVITNAEIAKKAFLSVDGIGSSLRRMYDYFEIKESKYKKISLLSEAIKISKG